MFNNSKRGNSMQIKKTDLEKKILKLGTKDFLEKGYNKTSVRKIARDCNISPGNFYSYFKSKEDLYMNVTLAFNQDRIDTLYKEMRKGKTAEERLRNYSLAYLEYAKKNINKFRLFMYYELNGLNENNLSEKTKEKFITETNANRQEFKDVIEMGKANGEFSKRINTNQLIINFTLSIRIALNEVVLNYQKEDFFNDYLDFIMFGILENK